MVYSHYHSLIIMEIYSVKYNFVESNSILFIFFILYCYGFNCCLCMWTENHLPYYYYNSNNSFNPFNTQIFRPYDQNYNSNNNYQPPYYPYCGIPFSPFLPPPPPMNYIPPHNQIGNDISDYDLDKLYIEKVCIMLDMNMLLVILHY